MSRILPLSPPYNGLTSIVNVLKRVGPGEVNDPADVRVVQRLIQMGGRGSVDSAKVGLPSITGRFDSATGFWVYHLQKVQTGLHPHQIIDGIVSPAHGASYASNTSWVIVILNQFAKKHSPSEYSAFVSSGGEK